MRKKIPKHTQALFKLNLQKSSTFFNLQVFMEPENDGCILYNSSWHQLGIATSSSNTLDMSRSFCSTICDPIHGDHNNIFIGHMMKTGQVTNNIARQIFNNLKHFLILKNKEKIINESIQSKQDFVSHVGSGLCLTIYPFKTCWLSSHSTLVEHQNSLFTYCL